MEAHNIFRKVGSILAEINEQYQYLSESPEKLNELELELLAANADFLAEHIKVLKKLNPPHITPASIKETLPEDITMTDEYKESVSVPETIENPDELIKQDMPDSYSSFQKPVENELPAAKAAIEGFGEDDEPEPKSDVPPAPSNVIREVAEPVTENNTFNTFFIPEANPVNSPELSKQQSDLHSVIEEVAAEIQVTDNPELEMNLPEAAGEPVKVPTINEIMSAQRSQDSAFNKSNKEQPVSDLKSIINLNDKLLFIKDLFNGYSLAYSEAIEIINRFDSFAAADNFLKVNYSAKNNWASKQTTADKFYELLNRRFSK